MIDRWGVPDKRSLFGFCPNSGDFSVDSLHKRLFLTPLTGEIFEQQKVPNLIWRSWSELVDSYSWVYKSHKNQRNRISYAGWDARIFDTSWVANMITIYFSFSLIWRLPFMPHEKEAQIQNIYLFSASMIGDWWWENNTFWVPKVENALCSCKKCFKFDFLQMLEKIPLGGICEIGSGYEQLASCVCGEQIGIIAALMGKLS